MPRRTPTACNRSGCPGVVRDRVCSVCGPRRRESDVAMDDRRGSSSARGYDSRWERVRRMKLQQSPICERCAEEGRTTLAYDVHHIVPIRLAPELRLDLDNLKSVCRMCHALLEKEVRDAEKL